jgi:hypothetical protein
MTREFFPLPDKKNLKNILLHYREILLREIQSVKDLMALLMKGTREKWSKDEMQNIKIHFARLSKRVPVLMVFLLPGGLVLLPVLVEVLERRKKVAAVTQERRKGL